MLMNVAEKLTAHPPPRRPHRSADAPEPRTFTYLQDLGRGWLIVSRAHLDSVGMSPADFLQMQLRVRRQLRARGGLRHANVPETSR
jgi:hypothetical protein